MNLASIIVLIVFGVCFIAALIHSIRKPGCGGDCRNCGMYSGCKKNDKKHIDK